jgi:hypothetical protein
LIWLIIICEAPVDKSQVSLFVVDYDVQGFDVSVHDSVAVSEFEGFQNFVGVEADVHVIEGLRDDFRLDVGDVLKNQAGCLRNGISKHIVQFYDIGSAIQSLQYLGFSMDFFLAHRFKDFDDARLVVLCVASLVHFGVLSTSKLLDDLVAIEFCPVD